jgi:gas vesicle protein
VQKAAFRRLLFSSWIHNPEHLRRIEPKEGKIKHRRTTMSTWKFWAAFGVGVAAGAALALIYAPQTGVRTRRQIRRGVSDASEYLNDAANTVSDAANKYIKRGKETMGDVVDSAQNVVTAAKKVVSFS